MDSVRSATAKLSVRATTWFKDSHSLYDYETEKVSSSTYDFPLTTPPLYAFRRTSPTQPSAVVSTQLQPKSDYNQIARFEVKTLLNKTTICFLPLKLSSQRMPTEQSVPQTPHSSQEPYLIVSKMVSGEEATGYSMNAGDTIKLGRVEYFVSEVRIGGVVKQAKMHRVSGRTMVYDSKPQKKYSCKVCLDEEETQDNFICWPCKCLQQCGAIHVGCLKEWIRVKVKSEVVGCTTHYNFQKFMCEICLGDLPVEIRGNDHVHEILPIVKPMGNYMMMEGASEKTNSILIIESVLGEGIRLGRSHDCQIRIDDISVSRNHALIKFAHNKFIIFDHKSKFGTLVKYPNMQVEMSGKNGCAVQIGRTILEFEIRRPQMVEGKRDGLIHQYKNNGKKDIRSRLHE